ncbi:MAG: ABC transporter ATP-binding protein [Pseudomonadales bacterium]|nr:ABC transporter ATP-binding protein [Pseudomonadales bacterium]
MAEIKEPDKKIVMEFKDAGVCFYSSLNIFNRRKIWAFKDLSFKLYEGETLGIIGKNGAGKSTLMKLMAGIINADKGTVVRRVGTVQLLALQVGFLQHLSGRENAILSGILLGMRKKQMVELMDSIIEFSELGVQIDDEVRTYSSGMKARLGFAVACHTDPDVLLIDEVLGVGDSRFKEKSRKVMVERIRSNKTVVLISHNEETIMEFCDRAILLNNGSIEGVGSPEEIIQAYSRI